MTTSPGIGSELRDALLAFGRPAYQPTAGFAWLDGAGRPTPQVPQHTYVTCRMTYVWSLELMSSNLDNEEARAKAEHGVGLLSQYFRDRVHSGWFASMEAGSNTGNPAPHDVTKACYPHAFVVLAAATAAQAEVRGALSLLDDALEVLFCRFWDEASGMFVEDYSRDFTSLSEYRGLNSAMHAVEALLAAWDLLRSERELTALVRIVTRVLDLAEEWGCRLPEHFSPTWDVLQDYNVDNPRHPTRPYGSTPGHWCEWARLLLHTRAALIESGSGDELLISRCVSTAQALFDRAWADAWEVDGAPGMVFTVDFAGTPIVHTRLHWVACEAVGAAQTLSSVNPTSANVARAQTLWQFIVDHHVDPAGGWFHELDGSLRPSSQIRKGKADLYHAYQATLLPEIPVTPSLASGLRSRLFSGLD